jgi:galactokinase
VVICDTRAARNLVGSEYDDRRAECEEGVRIIQKHDPTVQALRDVTLEQFSAYEAEMRPVIARRGRFIIEENQRVLELAAVLPAFNSQALNELFTASYEGARDLFEIGAPPMTSMMRAMKSGPGIVAARQAGAGFGGCMIALIMKDETPQFCDHVQQTYTAETSIQPHTYVVAASPGAGALKL